jgi:Ca2+-binding EF-hand superfamily protein
MVEARIYTGCIQVVVVMIRSPLLLLLCAAFTGSKSQELGTEENPLPAEDESEEGAPLKHYEDEGHEVTVKHLEELHDHLDGNKDGKVSVQELLEFHREAHKVMAKHEIEDVFHEIESTRDGSLSLEEHIKETKEVHEGLAPEEKAKVLEHETAKFQASDINGDGQLDAGELVHLMHPETHPEVLDLHVAENMRKKDENGDSNLSEKEWGEDEVIPFADLDTNKDGVVDKEELKHFESGDMHTKGAMTQLLQDADTDGDGHVSKEEMGKFADKLEEHPAQHHVIDWVFHYLEDKSVKVSSKEEI